MGIRIVPPFGTGGGGGGGGTVTSVGLTADPIFTVTGSPIIGAGTIDVSLNPQTHGKFLATPTLGSPAVPAFRVLAAGDIESTYPLTSLETGVLRIDATDIVLTNGANDDIALGSHSLARFTGPSAAFSVSGFAGDNSDGDLLIVHFLTTGTLTLKNQATSLSANQITTGTGADVTTAQQDVWGFFVYQASDSKWKLISLLDPNAPVPAHDLLSATHPDTLTASPVAGDLVVANSTPKWSRLIAGPDGKPLRMSTIAGNKTADWVDDPTAGTIALSNGANNNVALGATLSDSILITGPSGAFSITGVSFSTGWSLTRVTLVNSTSQTMTIAHQSGSSSVGNRITCPGGVDLVLAGSGGAVTLDKNVTGDSTNPWRVVSSESTGVYTPPVTTKGDLFGFSSVAARVPIGSDAQVLTADSAQALGLKWATPAASPLTTKGDVYTHSTVDARLAVGADGKVLTAASGQTTGLDWTTPFTSPLTTKGDLLGHTTVDARVAVGTTDGQVLTVDSTASSGVRWVTGAGGGATNPAWVESNQTGLKIINTVYQNTSGHDMLVFVPFTHNGTTTATALSDSSNPPTTTVSQMSSTNGYGNYFEFWVKNGDYYKIPTAGVNLISNWIEFVLTRGSITDSGDIVGSRALTTVYQNTTGSAIWVAIQFGTGGTGVFLSDASNPPTTQIWTNKISAGAAMTAMVPVLNGHYYKVTATTATLVRWHEYTLNGFTVTRSANIGANTLYRLVNNNQISYFNNLNGAIYGICSLHTNGTTSSVLSRFRAVLANTGTQATFVGTNDPVISFMSSTTTDIRSINYTINPGEFYTIFIDSGTLGAYDNWYEWLIN